MPTNMNEVSRPGLLFRAFAHATATAVVIGAALGLTAVSYVGLILWAIFSGEPLGGVLAMPFMLLVALAGSSAAALFVCFPVTVTAAVLCGRTFRWSRVAEIPVCAALCLAEVVLTAIVIAWVRGKGIADASVVGLVFALALLLPLALYWWSLQAVGAGRFVVFTLWNRFRAKTSAVSAVPPPT